MVQQTLLIIWYHWQPQTGRPNQCTVSHYQGHHFCTPMFFTKFHSCYCDLYLLWHSLTTSNRFPHTKLLIWPSYYCLSTIQVLYCDSLCPSVMQKLHVLLKLPLLVLPLSPSHDLPSLCTFCTLFVIFHKKLHDISRFSPIFIFFKSCPLGGI